MEHAIEVVANGNGLDNCVEILMEECAELIQACSKYLRMKGKGTPTREKPRDIYQSLVEEVGDVKICIDQLVKAVPLDEDAIDLGMQFKVHRRLMGLYEETGDKAYLEEARKLELKMGVFDD